MLNLVEPLFSGKYILMFAGFSFYFSFFIVSLLRDNTVKLALPRLSITWIFLLSDVLMGGVPESKFSMVDGRGPKNEQDYE